ncbi:MAG: hypothetical protein H8E38_01600 [SAR324 cluster bacterium]|nr:hypothetical protein [SAR324 cluster bacterium]MBL7035433.1 hypothetical protein [SAR324 cluster bacterium]
MSKKDNEPPEWLQKLFSTQGILTAILVLGVYWVFVGEDKSRESARYNYNSQNIPIGVSERLNAEAIEKLGIDLTEHLDPQLIPAITAEALKETSQANVSEESFLATLVSKISNKIRDISTIDLNEDGIADPVLIVPQTETGADDFLVFSILVPDPSKISVLPAGSDQEAWREIAQNKAIEVMTASVVRTTGEQMTMQATPNPQMYQSSGAAYPPYYGSGYSMTNMLMTSMMMSMLFRPPYIWGGGFGYGYGYGRPMAVNTVKNRRSSAASNLRKATPAKTAAKTAGGKNVSANKFRSTSKKSLNNIKSTKFRSANRKASGGGFANSRTTQRKPGVTKSRRTVNRRRSIFGSSRRRRGFSFGGFGRRRR